MISAFQRAWTMPIRRPEPSCCSGVGPFMLDVYEQKCGLNDRVGESSRSLGEISFRRDACLARHTAGVVGRVARRAGGLRAPRSRGVESGTPGTAYISQHTERILGLVRVLLMIDKPSPNNDLSSESQSCGVV
jgi:hypothetical protein